MTPGCEPDCFLPATLTIASGDTVEFANNDVAAHTSTAGTPVDGSSGAWDSSLVMPGASFTTPALDAGEYPYYCMVHPWMTGLVIVQDNTEVTNDTIIPTDISSIVTLYQTGLAGGGTPSHDSFTFKVGNPQTGSIGIGVTLLSSSGLSGVENMGYVIVLILKDPDGGIVSVEQFNTNSTGGVQHTLVLPDSFVTGTYTITAESSGTGYSLSTSKEVSVEASTPTEPEPAPEPEATSSSSNTVENAQGSATPGCEPDCFIPATVTVGVGGMVEFANNDVAAHTSTSGTPQDGPSGIWDSSLVMRGASFTTPALSEGTYPYFCMVHPWMMGTVIVGEGGVQTTSEETSQAEAEAAERIAAAEAAAAAAEAEAAAAAAEAEARIAEAEAAVAASEEAALAAEEAAQERIAATASVNEKIEISMDFTNDTDVQQPFALIVQIKDSNNTTISLSHVTGMLGGGQTLDQILSYTPTEAGTYTVEKFLWDNIADPTALTDEKETFTLTVS